MVACSTVDEASVSVSVSLDLSAAFYTVDNPI